MPSNNIKLASHQNQFINWRTTKSNKKTYNKSLDGVKKKCDEERVLIFLPEEHCGWRVLVIYPKIVTAVFQRLKNGFLGISLNHHISVNDDSSIRCCRVHKQPVWLC